MTDRAEAILTRWEEQLPSRRRANRGNIAGGLVLLERLKSDFDLDLRSHRTPDGYQLQGATAARVSEILARHGESRLLAKEGGRTNSGLLPKMEVLLEVLRDEGAGEMSGGTRGELLDAMQAGLARRATEQLNAPKPPIAYRRGLSVREALRRILHKAKTREQKRRTVHCLLGAGLELRFPELLVENSSGDLCHFSVGRSAFQAANFPEESDCIRCRRSAAAGRAVYLVVPGVMFEAARENAELELGGKVVLLSCESFISLAVDEAANFSPKKVPGVLAALLEKYCARAGF